MPKHQVAQNYATRPAHLKHRAGMAVLAIFLIGSVLTQHPTPVQAWCYYYCLISEGPGFSYTKESKIQELIDHDTDKHDETRDNVNDHTDEQFQQHKDWMLNTVWAQWLLPNMAKLTEQISATGLQQMEVIGTFLDAKEQLETQRLLQQSIVTAYKDYAVSEGLCTIGSAARSLGGSDRNVELTSALMSRRSLDRQLLKANTSGAEGSITDRESRFAQFQKRYCDKSDNTAGLSTVCQHDTAVPVDRLNADIDYFRTIARPGSLELNLSVPDATDDENDVFALQSNLYAHQLPATFESGKMKGTGQDQTSSLQKYLDMRSVTAQRSVAENSYNEIAAMKSAGQTSQALTAKYLKEALKEMGISQTDATKIIGENPSYYAQMEILTRRMFQRPEFFVDLYDKPANIERKSVALQAVSVMQRRDIFKSALRTEAMMSLLLELDVAKAQEKVQSQLEGKK